MDLSQPAHPPQATQYYQLGRAALGIKSVFDEQSIPGIQALVCASFTQASSTPMRLMDGIFDLRQLIMCHFMFWNDEGARWVVMGIVVKLAQSVSELFCVFDVLATIHIQQVGLRESPMFQFNDLFLRYFRP